MNAGLMCSREVYLAESDEPVLEAARRMEEANVGTLIVLDSAKRPIGILTDRDLALRVLARGIDPKDTPVNRVMTKQPIVVDEQTPIEGVLALMRRHDIRRLPVVGLEGALLGIVSLDDVMDFLAQQFAELRTLLERSQPHRVQT